MNMTVEHRNQVQCTFRRKVLNSNSFFPNPIPMLSSASDERLLFNLYSREKKLIYVFAVFAILKCVQRHNFDVDDHGKIDAQRRQ